MSVNYTLPADAALVLQYGTANQAVVKGLNAITLPTYERSVISVEEFRNDLSRQFSGGGRLGNITISGNLVLGDTLGQDKLKDYWINRTAFTDARLYLDLNNFVAPDLVADSTNGWQVSSYSPGNADKNAVFPLSVVIVCNGQPSVFASHITSTGATTGYELTYVLTTDADDTLTDGDSRFVDEGFVAGDTLWIEVPGTPSTLRTITGMTIKTVAAGTLTLDGEGLFAAGQLDSGVLLHGGRI